MFNRSVVHPNGTGGWWLPPGRRRQVGPSRRWATTKAHARVATGAHAAPTELGEDAVAGRNRDCENPWFSSVCAVRPTAGWTIACRGRKLTRWMNVPVGRSWPSAIPLHCAAGSVELPADCRSAAQRRRCCRPGPQRALTRAVADGCQLSVRGLEGEGGRGYKRNLSGCGRGVQNPKSALYLF